MSKRIYSGRYTAENADNVVVFIIGMRINKPLAIHKWLPVSLAMPGMVKELYSNKDKLGFLSMESFFGLRTTVMIQYWRSTDDLLTYARNGLHLEAWKRFNDKVGNNNAVGVYHETYEIKRGDYECIYVNMPQYGLGKALKHIPITPELHSARHRLNPQKEKA